MPVSRRDFLSAVGAAGAVGAGSTFPWISARGQESRLAVALGHLTPSSVRVWARCSEPGRYSLVAHGPGAELVSVAEAKAYAPLIVYTDAPLPGAVAF